VALDTDYASEPMSDYVCMDDLDERPIKCSTGDGVNMLIRLNWRSADVSKEFNISNNLQLTLSL
jgi:hypothetical protein